VIYDATSCLKRINRTENLVKIEDIGRVGRTIFLGYKVGSRSFHCSTPLAPPEGAQREGKRRREDMTSRAKYNHAWLIVPMQRQVREEWVAHWRVRFGQVGSIIGAPASSDHYTQGGWKRIQAAGDVYSEESLNRMTRRRADIGHASW
jgi:hypothetical protein